LHANIKAADSFLRHRKSIEEAKVKSRLWKFFDQSIASLYVVGLVVAVVFGLWIDSRPRPPEPPAMIKPRHPDLLLMDSVRAVNADASMLLLTSARGATMDQPFACLLAQSVAARQDFPASALKKLNTECTFWTAVRKATRPVFHGIAESKSLPETPFTFDAYVGSDEKWDTLGLFADLETCSRMVETAMSLGIGVRACQPWKPRF
jgi:hypothetical protein